MKAHRRIILISILIGCVMLFLITYGYMNHLEELNPSSVILSTFLTIWLISFPTSLYSTYRLIGENMKTGYWLGRFIDAVYGGIFGGVFLVPFVLGPIMLPTYIQFYKRDSRTKDSI